MNDSLILRLVFDGDCYSDKIRPWENVEYAKYMDKLNSLCEKLCEHLPEKDRQEAVNKLVDVCGGVESVTADLYFNEGFKLGLRLGAENFLD